MQALDGRFYASQIKGDRNYQEDEFGLLDLSTTDPTTDGTEVERHETLLMILADGMGGHSGGGVASSLVVRAFLDIFERAQGRIAQRLEKALLGANNALHQAQENNRNLKGMGTTLVAIVVSDAGLEWISVGDSPFWLYREGVLERLNEDHSFSPVLDDMVATGRLTNQEKAQDGRKNILRSALMGDEIELIDTSSQPKPLQSDDILLIASDGIETLDHNMITKLLKKNRKHGLDACGQLLLEGVEKLQKDNQDNCTVMLYCPYSPPSEANEKPIKNAILEKILKFFSGFGGRLYGK